MDKQRLANLLNELVPQEGVIVEAIPRVNLFRITEASSRTAQQYEPGILILAQGNKRLFIGDEVYTYDALNYLVLSVPLPLECETNASVEEPLLGVRINVDATIVGEIMLAIEDHKQISSAVTTGIFAAPLDAVLMDAAIRLVESLKKPARNNFLGPLCVKEIIYHVLMSENGDALRSLAEKSQKFFQIAKVLNTIHGEYNEKLELEDLARDAGMSISAFHSSFKAVTNITPLQYIKNTRLHKARMLMRTEGMNAARAGYEVGYESPSQFNREYKRLFGAPPGKESAGNLKMSR